MTEYILAAGVAGCFFALVKIWFELRGWRKADQKYFSALCSFARSHSGDLTAINNATSKTWHIIEELKTRVKGN